MNAGYAASNPAGTSNTLSIVYVGGAVRAGSGEVLSQVIQQRQQSNQVEAGSALAAPTRF